MVLANITDYSVGLFIHILAVVLTFGPTFGYGFLFSVMPKIPAGGAGADRGIQKIDRYLVTPGMLVILLAGIYLLVEGHLTRAAKPSSPSASSRSSSSSGSSTPSSVRRRPRQGARRTRLEDRRHPQPRVRRGLAHGSARSARSPA